MYIYDPGSIPFYSFNTIKMLDPIETIQYKNHTIEVYPDEDPQDPREDDNLTVMLCSHRNYNLWDEKLANYWVSFEDDLMKYIWNKYLWYYTDEIEEADEKKIRDRINQNIVRDNLYLYDHSWITISTSRFWCQWDSWQVWIIYILKSEILDNRSDLKDKEDKDIMKKWYEIIKNEVKEYDNYITWSVYGYTVSGKHCDDSCRWYTDDKYMIQEAKASIDHCIQRYTDKHIEKVKAYITNKVPFENREAYSI